MSLSHNSAQTTSAGVLATNPSGKRKWSGEEKQLRNYEQNENVTERNTSRWLDDEKQLFEQGLQLFGRNYAAIAATIPSRSVQQVKARVKNLLLQEKENAREKNTGSWNDNEKQLFHQGLDKYGPKWSAIAETIPSRTAQQVCHYANSLRRREKENATEKNMGPWNIDEEQLFCQSYKIHGRKWSAIAETIPGRTAIQVQTHGYLCLRTYGPEDYAYVVEKQAQTKQILASNTIKVSSDDYLDPIVQMKYASVFQENSPSKEGSAAAAVKTMEDWFASEYKKDNQDDVTVNVPV